ncbi:MAG TPA: hypothetical protein PKA37_14065 [Planctomycetota bacterium]|nr:hypothetical protein [Planctomycetota bacterium]
MFDSHGIAKQVEMKLLTMATSANDDVREQPVNELMRFVSTAGLVLVIFVAWSWYRALSIPDNLQMVREAQSIIDLHLVPWARSVAQSSAMENIDTLRIYSHHFDLPPDLEHLRNQLSSIVGGGVSITISIEGSRIVSTVSFGMETWVRRGEGPWHVSAR